MPPDGSRVAVVMPLFNEERHVEGVLRGLPQLVDDVVVVDDGSTDGSAQRVASAADPRVRLVRHARRSGVGRALGTGYREALRAGADVMVTLDADGQMDVADLPLVLAPLVSGDASYVKGCRLHPSVDLRDMPHHRRIANRALSAAAAWLLEEPRLKDAHSGYTAARREVVRGLDLDMLHPSYGVYTSILEQVLRMSHTSVAYVPVRAVYGDETSHFRARDALGLVRLNARMLVRRWQQPARARAAPQQESP